MQSIATTPSRSRALEFGIYRDGDNNLDLSQSAAVAQALQSSRSDSAVEYTVEDTTAQSSAHTSRAARLHTDDFTIADGKIADVHTGKPRDMSDESNLARFVARTLDNAEADGVKQTWIDLVDHGGGDGGGLQTGDGSCMSMPDIAKAISDGVALHAKEHPEDAGRNVDGVVANQCLMDTMGFADALSHAGVKYLAASPETMLAPGTPSSVAHAIAGHAGDPREMARAVVDDVMNTKYFPDDFGGFAPAAAFDVLDLDPSKIARADAAIKRFNDDAVAGAKDPGTRGVLRDDVASIDGMVRFPDATKDMPWHADRPAIAVYDTIASDGRLGATLRSDALAARNAVGDLVLAHRESTGFEPFGGADYSDAAGPTLHLPTSKGQIDPWAGGGVSETGNAFYHKTDADALTGVLA